MDSNLPEKTRERISKIPGQVDQMKSHLNRFKSMVYKNHEDFEVFDINYNLKEFVSTVEVIKPKNITLNCYLYDDHLYVNGDYYQLLQVYLNLARNAFDAMDEGGSFFNIISRKADRKYLQNSEVALAFHSEGEEQWQNVITSADEFALLILEDDGPGMTEETLSHIFNSFFSTKRRVRRAGLGLSIARDIAKRHRGDLAVFSQVGKGTKMFLTLPLTKNQPQTIYK